MDITEQMCNDCCSELKKFYKKTRRRVRIDGNKPVGFDKKKLECFKCHNTGHFARECDNGVNILKSIDEGPFQMGTTRGIIAEGTEGPINLGPERPRVYSELSSGWKVRYNADIRTNILLQGLPKDIYTLINHYTNAKDIWDNNKGETIHDYYVWFAKLINDMRNIKMTMSRMQLNSKFVNNMLPEWGRFVTAVKLNRGLRDSNYDQLYAYLKQHEAHANENKMMLDRFTQHTVDPLALMSNVSHQQYYLQSSTTLPCTYVPPHFADNTQLDSGLSPPDNLIKNLTNILALLTQSYKTYLPQTNNQLRTSSNPRNQATVQDDMVVVQNVQGRQNRGQGNNAWGAGATGYGGAQNRVGNANPGQARQVKCYNCNGIVHIARNFTQPKHPPNSEYFKDKMLLMQAQENGVALDEEQLLFIAGGQDNAIDEYVDEQPVQDLPLNVDNVFQADDCDAFDSDVDEAPTIVGGFSKSSNLRSLVSLVQELMNSLKGLPPKTVNASGEELVEDISPNNSRSCAAHLNKILGGIEVKFWYLNEIKNWHRLDVNIGIDLKRPSIKKRTKNKVLQEKLELRSNQINALEKLYIRKTWPKQVHLESLQAQRSGCRARINRGTKEKEGSSTKIPINHVPVATKSPSIANYKIIKQGRKGVYQIVRENGTDMVYISFGAMLTDISRDDLTELYRIVMKKHGMNEPEDEFEKVLWEYLKNMFEEPLSTDSIWSLPGQQRIICWRYYDACRVHCLNLESADIYMLIERKYPLSAEVCKAMLDKKLQGGKPDEDCYKLLKMMEKQAGIRK
ncbi:retrovirus-related pol polyprotein from transposon TNT 1-94 [Tanacetum coccineum]